MDKRQICVLNWPWAEKILSNPKIKARSWFPMGAHSGWLKSEADVLLRFRGSGGRLQMDPSAHLACHKTGVYIKSESLMQEIPVISRQGRYVYLIVEGTEDRARITVQFDDGRLMDRLQNDDPTLRAHVYDLPPATVTIIDTASVVRAVLKILREHDRDLHSRRTDEFVRYPHILLALFSHVVELRSQDQIDFVSTLRCVADQFRELLEPYIRKVEKSHQRLWAEWYGRRLSFVDGGLARIVGLPGTEPIAVRVGVYTVVPGEVDLNEREDWRLCPYVAGDMISSPADPDSEHTQPPDRKRLQEAARYIAECLTVVQLAADRRERPDIVFVHGPLVNSFEMYDEGEPHFIPAVDPEFLYNSCGATEQGIVEKVSSIPRRRDGTRMWNQCMAVYGYLVKRVFEIDIPVAGVVERSTSAIVIRALIERLKNRAGIREAYIRKLRRLLEDYRITDELLFGCVLDEGEYIDPIPIQKNVIRRARDSWQPVVAQYPHPAATYLKTSAFNFPYRIETNHAEDMEDFRRLMDLVYHTSRLLPEYAFPVGLDIVDKYARVPDWLSKGVSAAIAAQVLAKAVTTGQPRVLQQVRKLLAQSPRDFYFRPQAR